MPSLGLTLGMGLTGGSSGVPATDPVVENQTLDFGALTKASAGGDTPINSGAAITSASIDSGNTGTHWQISATGVITPTAAGDTADLNLGPYALGCTFNSDGGTDTATITITPSAATFSTISKAEIEAAAAVAVNSNTILHRAVDIVSPDLSSLTFTAGTPLTVKAEGSVVHATEPSLSTRPAKFTGPVDMTSSTAIYVEGFEVDGDVNRGGTNADTTGVFDVTGTTASGIVNCEIYSEIDLEGATTAKTVGGVVKDLQLQKAVHSDNATELDTFELSDCYVYNCQLLINPRVDGLKVKRNDCDFLYNGFVVTRGTGNVEVFDNRLRNIWAGALDEDESAALVHAGMGGGDGWAATTQDNISWIGNTLTSGRARFDFDGAQTASTGVKFNDPDFPATADGYSDLTFKFNSLFIGSNLALEITGVNTFDVQFNTIIRSYDWKTIGSGGSPATGVGMVNIGDEGGVVSTNGTVYNNITENIFPSSSLAGYTGINDSSDAFRLFSNSFVRDSATAGVNSRNADDFFVGTLSNGMTLEEQEAAYVPESWTYAKTSGVAKQGALGTGYYTRGDDGVDTAPTVTIPVSATGTAHVFATTVWDGAVSYITASTVSSTDSKILTFLVQGEFTNDNDTISLVSSSGGQLQLQRHVTDNNIRIYLENSSGAKILQVETPPNASTAFFDSQPFSLAVSVDLGNDRIAVGLNGRSIHFNQLNPTATTEDDMADDNISSNGISLRAMGAVSASDQLVGKLDLLAIDQRFIDLDTLAGLQDVFSSTGPFIDLSADGWDVYLDGDAADVGTNDWNTGTWPEFTTKDGSGTVTDDNPINETTWTSSEWLDLVPAGLPVNSDAFTIAGKIKLTDLSSDVYMFGEGFNTYMRVFASPDGDTRSLVEDSVGTNLVLQDDNTNYTTGTYLSFVFSASKTAAELVVNGSTSWSVTYSTSNQLKNPEVLNGITDTGTFAEIMNWQCVWVTDAFIDPSTHYSSFFDGSDIPTSTMLSGGDINSISPVFSESGNGASWAARTGMNGTPGDV